MAKPFLKWAGGKRSLLPHLFSLVPPEWLGTERPRYHEPFLGGGALFFALEERLQGRLRAELADLNEELMNCWRHVADLPAAVAAACGAWPTDGERHYYEVRSIPPSVGVVGAARTIYLNKTGFNGLYRVGATGAFNVPWGKRRNVVVAKLEELEAASAAIQGAASSLATRPFERSLELVRPGELVYLDPPYVPVSKTSHVAYQAGGFDYADQETLAKAVDRLAASGAWVLLSNADTPWVRDRYSRHALHFVEGRRSISSDGEGREPARDVLVAAGPGFAKGRKVLT